MLEDSSDASDKLLVLDMCRIRSSPDIISSSSSSALLPSSKGSINEALLKSTFSVIYMGNNITNTYITNEKKKNLKLHIDNGIVRGIKLKEKL